MLATPLLGFGGSGMLATPLFGRGGSGIFATPLRCPAYEIAMLVAITSSNVIISARKRLAVVDIKSPSMFLNGLVDEALINSRVKAQRNSKVDDRKED